MWSQPAGQTHAGDAQLATTPHPGTLPRGRWPHTSAAPIRPHRRAATTSSARGMVNPHPSGPRLSTVPLRCTVVATRRQPLAAAAGMLGVGPAPLVRSGVTTGGLALVPVRRRAAGAAVPPRRSRGTGVAAITAVVPAASRTSGLPRSPPAHPPQPNTWFRGFEEVNLLTMINYWVQQWGRAPAQSWVRGSRRKKGGRAPAGG